LRNQRKNKTPAMAASTAMIIKTIKAICPSVREAGPKLSDGVGSASKINKIRMSVSQSVSQSVMKSPGLFRVTYA